MTKEILTQERLKELLSYDPDTGLFTWIVARSGVKPSRNAGYKNGKGYMCIEIFGRQYKSHRLAFLYMTGCFPKYCVDHVNHIKDDNQWCNLREATNQENHKNRGMHSRNTSGTTGVYWDRFADKWTPKICVNGKLKHLGYFRYYLTACIIRKRAEIEYGYHKNHGK